MASSTTMPMASTIPKSESVFIEKPRRGNTINVAISETGTVIKGISVALQFWRKTNTTSITSTTASMSVVTISLILSSTGSVVSSDTEYSIPGGKVFDISLTTFLMSSAT